MKMRAECDIEHNGEVTFSVWLGKRCVVSATIDGEFMPDIHEEIGIKLADAVNHHAADIGP